MIDFDFKIDTKNGDDYLEILELLEGVSKGFRKDIASISKNIRPNYLYVEGKHEVVLFGNDIRKFRSEKCTQITLQGLKDLVKSKPVKFRLVLGYEHKDFVKAHKILFELGYLWQSGDRVPIQRHEDIKGACFYLFAKDNHLTFTFDEGDSYTPDGYSVEDNICAKTLLTEKKIVFLKDLKPENPAESSNYNEWGTW